MSFVAPHGLARTTGPNQLLGAAPNGQLIAYDLTASPVGSFLGRTADGLGILTTTSGTSPFGDGTVAAPSITFTSDLDTGIYRVGANSMGITANGVNVATFNTSGLSLTNGLVVGGVSTFADGSVGAPSIAFTADQDTGLFRIGSNSIGASVGGVLSLELSSTNLRFGVNSLAAITTGTGNIGIGTDAGAILTDGSNNVCIGLDAGRGSTSTSNGVFIGNNSGNLASDNIINIGTGQFIGGANSIALGVNSTTASDNSVVVGPNSSITGGGSAVVIGSASACVLSDGAVLIGAGVSCPSTTTNGVVIGRSSVGSGTGCVVIGGSAGTTGMGNDNVAIGRDALDGVKTNAVTGIVAIGANSMGSSLTGIAAVNSVAVGSGSLVFQSSGTSNTAIGNAAGGTVTTGSNCTFLGASADSGLGSASSVTVIGSAASSTGASNTIAVGAAATTSGDGCIVIGQSAGSSAMGASNIAIGIDCLDGAKTNSPTGIVAIGPLAMRGAVSTAACNSVAVGSSALASVTSGAGNTAIGFSAGDIIVTGAQNVVVGNLADVQTSSSSNAVVVGASSTGQAECTVVGHGSSANSTSVIVVGQGSTATGTSSIIIGNSAGSTGLGINNVAIGQDCFDGAKTNSPTGIVAIGPLAMRGAVSTAASNNTAVGFSTLAIVTAGTDNTAVGHNAGSATLTTGSNNTLLGSGTSVSAAARAGTVVLGQGASGILDDGLFFRTATAIQAGGVAMNFDSADGRAGPVSSSIRFKTDVALAPYEASLSKLTAIDRIRVVEFKGKNAAHEDPILGMIAEEIKDHVHPSLVPRDDLGDPFGIDYARLTCMLVQEVQFLRRELANIKTPLSPLPALGPYTPVSEAVLYPAEKRGDDALMAAQKEQGKTAKIERAVNRIIAKIEKEPDREAAIMAEQSPDMQAKVRAEQERRAMAEAEAQAKAEEEERLRREAEEAEADAEEGEP